MCSLKENSENPAKKTRSSYDITDFYNNEGFCGLKWDKANKSTEFVVPSIQNSLEEHLGFVLQKSNVLCLKLVDLNAEDMEVVTSVLHSSKARVSHMQLVLDRAWSVTIRTSKEESADVFDITDEDLLSLGADSIEFFGLTKITARGARKLIQEWLAGKRKISLVYFRHIEEFDPGVLLRKIPHKGNVPPVVITRADGEELRLTWDAVKFRCFADEADDEGDDEFPEDL
ncbi:unnamed protein product [Cylicostephanus goldi]|uniref:F-box associated domain-containing protein n=1 Tax=Cylicostephanus goldi TaxID=71465 RepID=A0A3P7MJS6_CYLGO|nr:unnamed protein product [Cylicostephanus goldi]